MLTKKMSTFLKNYQFSTFFYLFDNFLDLPKLPNDLSIKRQTTFRLNIISNSKFISSSQKEGIGKKDKEKEQKTTFDGLSYKNGWKKSYETNVSLNLI